MACKTRGHKKGKGIIKVDKYKNYKKPCSIDLYKKLS